MTPEEAQLLVQPYYDKISAMTSAEEIRKFLADEGIQGYRSCANSCALAKYLHQHTGIRFTVSSYIAAHFENGETVQTGPREWVLVLSELVLGRPTWVVLEFIKNFDAGLYPELIAWGDLTIRGDGAA